MPLNIGPAPVVNDPIVQQAINIIWQTLENLDPPLGYFIFDAYHTEPTLIAVGATVYADGTDWDPGSGAGLYRWDGSTWEKL